MFTKLFYAAGSWPPLSRRQLAIVKKAYVQMTRLVTRTHYKGTTPGVTDEKVLAMAGFMDVQSRLTQERLRYAARLFRHGEDFMLKVLEAEAKLTPMAWLHQLRADWDWLTSVQGPSWGSTLPEGIQFWKAGRGGWKRFLSAAGSKHRLQQDIFYTIRGRRKDSQPTEIQEAMEGYECACGKVFNTKRAWAMHATVVHGRRTATYEFGGTRCLTCMRELWTTGRLRQHVTYIQKGAALNLCGALARHHGCIEQADTPTKPVPLPGLRRRERIRIPGPLVCGADQDHKEYITREQDVLRDLIEKELHLTHMADGLQLDAFEDIEITFRDSGLEHLHELFTFLDFSEGQRAVTYLMWGKSRTWSDSDAYLRWRDDFLQCRMGAELWDWFRFEGISSVIFAPIENEKERPRDDAGARSSERAELGLCRRVLELTWPEVSAVGISLHEFLSLKKPGVSLAFLQRFLHRLG